MRTHKKEWKRREAQTLMEDRFLPNRGRRGERVLSKVKEYGALTAPNKVLVLLLAPNKLVSVCIVQNECQLSKANWNAEAS